MKEGNGGKKKKKTEDFKQAPKKGKETPLVKNIETAKPALPDRQATLAEKVESESVEAEKHEYERSTYIV